MITILSPSKTQDNTNQLASESAISHTLPVLLQESEKLVSTLRQKSPDALADLMGISDTLAHLNHERYQHFAVPFTPENARQALLTFQGDVYTDIAIEHYEKADFDFAQSHLRILSGLYGLLRPLDLIQRYRLEMKTPLKTERGTNLYQFWGDRITDQLNKAFQEQQETTLVNLASQEYSKVVDVKKLQADVVTPVFKEAKNGKFRTVAIYAKRARGKMANFIVRHRIDTPEQLKTFNEGQYEYSENLSSKNQWVFVR